MIQVIEERKKINEVLTPTNSIFTNMNYDFEIIESSQLDTLFYLNHGERRVSPLLNHFIRDGTILNEDLKEISNIILSFHKNKWDRLKKTIKLDYDVIHNFSDELKETTTIDESGEISNTGTNTTDISGSLTKTNNLTTTQTRNLSNSEKLENIEQTQAFNSSSFLNKDKDTSTNSYKNTGTLTNTDTGTQKDETTNKETITKNLSESTTDNLTKTKSVSRIGNIGNITTQQMLTQEIELWKWSFIKEILDDVKDLCGLQLYV